MRRHYKPRDPSAPHRRDSDACYAVGVVETENAATRAHNAKLSELGRCPRCKLLLPHEGGCLPEHAWQLPRRGFSEG